MDEPRIYMELQDGTNTWVSVCPISQLDHIGVEQAAGRAFVGFLGNLARERDAVDRHMSVFGIRLHFTDSD